ncbi:SDR family oxidoreductase [Nocardioides sp. CPCC 205120]|uniref:SDR family oxidoreductase n=1 Tax=Nocardioides sp. CPCC 205120 TaxID=3406462 RepID=UPI003B5064EA
MADGTPVSEAFNAPVGSTAVVTGAAGGIGRALAARLVAGGLRVVVSDRDEAATERVAAEVGAAGAVAGDLATAAGVEAVVAGAQAVLGPIDVWCGNAGVEAGHGLDADDAAWTLAQDVNVLAHVRAARLLVPGWVERGRGRFVVTASAAGLLTMLGSPSYSVTKHGAVAFAEWLSATYRHRGVVVQAICPQGVRTRMLEESGPLKELLTRDEALAPEDVAEALWASFADDRFLVLPHPQVADYYVGRARDTDRWLGQMNRLQQALEAGGHRA